MCTYIIRRLLYAIPILIGVNLLTFALFFMVNSPDEMARAQLGDKYVTQQTIDLWKEQNGYDNPLFFNNQAEGREQFTRTIFFQKTLRLFIFDFGRSESGRDITSDVSQRMWPSLYLALPTFLIGLWINICTALLVVLFRNTGIEKTFVVLFVVLMSVSYLFYIIAGQYMAARLWQLVPVSGFQYGWSSIKFLILPVIIGVLSGIGAGARLYRTLFLVEAEQEYARTAKAKGVGELSVLFKHILPNTMIPILTNVVTVIPMLFMGSLIMESFFGIPGLGSYTIDALRSQDFAIVRAMVFIGSVLYIVGLILTDISYTLVDPRVRLDG